MKPEHRLHLTPHTICPPEWTSRGCWKTSTPGPCTGSISAALSPRYVDAEERSVPSSVMYSTSRLVRPSVRPSVRQSVSQSRLRYRERGDHPRQESVQDCSLRFRKRDALAQPRHPPQPKRGIDRRRTWSWTWRRWRYLDACSGRCVWLSPISPLGFYAAPSRLPLSAVRAPHEGRACDMDP